MGARGRRKERRGERERERERRDDGARAPGEPRPEPATSPSPAGSHIPGASRVGARTPRRPAGRRRSGRPPVEGAGEERDARPAPAGAVRPPRTTLAGLSLSLSPHAPGGRAAAADAPAPRAGRRGPASHPTGGAANDPGDAAFPPPLAPRHPTGPRRRVPTAGESGRGRERERRSVREGAARRGGRHATTAGGEGEARAYPRGTSDRRTPPTSELRETEGPGERGPASRLPAARRDPPRGGETARGGGD